ncbi:alpha/beta hydrolase [Nemorincola caseinilytica]|uniref:Alpha/beta hydrolase n=1 Tax=Nemorincola caseinilytica TaxID=2054315 RepID=A0ABP8N5X7_9BACT
METLLLLHGAIGSSSQLMPLADALSATYDVHVPDLPGHGGRAFADAPFSMQLFAQSVLAYMDEKGLSKVSIFGYSMGGYVGMYLARHHAHRMNKVITLATKYHWDEATAAKEILMLDPAKIEAKLPAFAATLQQRHAPNDWKEVLKKTADMMVALGVNNTLKQEDHAAITTPVLVLLGDRDKMVTQDETLAVYKALPTAQLGILPGTPHPIEQVDAALLAALINRFAGQ